jgi:hypothetical protein
MDSEKFLTLVYAQSVQPTETALILRPRTPPTEEEFSRLPSIPVFEHHFEHRLALQLGSGGSPESFQATPNVGGVNLMVCKKWRFVNGLFENDETIVWPGAMMGGDVLIYDPNWPWMQLVVDKSECSKVRRIEETGQKKLGEESIGDKIERQLRNGHEIYGKYTWHPGQFKISPRALKQDIKDTRSPLMKSMEDRFEDQRKSHERYRASRVRDQPWAFDPVERRAAEKYFGMPEGFLDGEKGRKALQEYLDVTRSASASPPTGTTEAIAHMVEMQRGAEENFDAQVQPTFVGGYDPGFGPDLTVSTIVDASTGQSTIIDAEFEDVPEIVGKPDPDYSCGAAYCDDPACRTHGPKRKEDDDADH